MNLSTYTPPTPPVRRFMIDEELYQQATDELNSDRRRSHLWARACALASDDHDEARYLYTNLRVEELIAERERAPARAADTGAEFEPAELELSPVGFAGTAGAGEVAVSATDAGLASFRVGSDSPASAFLDDGDLLDLEPLNRGDTRPSSVRTESRLDEDALDDIDLDADELAAMNDLERAPTDDDIARARGHAVPNREANLDSTESFQAQQADEQWLDDELPDEQEPLDVHHTFDGSFEAPSGHEEPDLPVLTDVAEQPPVAAQTDVEHEQEPSFAEDEDEVAGAALAARRAFSQGARHDYADSRDLDELLEDEDDPAPFVDLDGRGTVWAVYETEEGHLKALRRGVSWIGLLFTLPWLLARGLFGTAVFYTLLWCVALGGAVLTGLAWMDVKGGAVATSAIGDIPILPAVCIGFLVIAALGLLVLPFFKANRWRENAWQRRGHALRGELRARNANDALQRMRAAARLSF